MRFAAVGLATALAYGVWVAWVPLLPRNLYVPLLDLGKITGYTWSSTLVYLGLVGVLYGLYGLGYRLAARNAAPTALIFGFGALFCVEMMFVYPATAVDVFGYIAHGRVLAIHGANPFVVVPFAFPTDPILPFLAFPNEPSQYGPLWVLIGGGLASIAATTGDPLLAEVLLYKLVALVAHLGGAVLVLLVARHFGAPSRACALLFLWNPTLLWEMVGNAHNDGLMMLGGLAAAWFLTRSAWVLVLPAIAAGALVKLPVVVLAPLFFLATWRHKRLLALEGAALALVLAVVVYRPFWQGLETLTALQRTDLFTASLGSVMRLLLEPAIGLELATPIARSVSQTLFAVVVVVCLLFAVRTPHPNPLPSRGEGEGEGWYLQRIVTLGYVTMLAAVLLATTWFQAWYVVWPFALAATLPEPRRHLEVALLALGGLLHYAVFIYLWVMGVLPPENQLIIQTAALAALLVPLLVGATLVFARRARYAH